MTIARRLRGAWRIGTASTVVFAFGLSGASSAEQIRPMRFTHLSVEQGLSQTTGFCGMQDSQGFVWIGTEDGLNRFDGYTVTVYRHDARDEASLPNDFVSSIAEDAAGDLWIGTDGGGLARWERKLDRFRSYRHDPKDGASLPSDRVRAVAVDRSGVVWVGTKGGGLARLDPSSGRFVRFRHAGAVAASLASDDVYALHEGRGGGLWVGTDAGVDRLDTSTGIVRHEATGAAPQERPRQDRVRAIEEDESGDLWVGMLDGGLVAIRSGSAPVRYRHDPKRPGSLPDDAVHAVLRDRTGRLWVGTRAGVDLMTSAGEFVPYRHDPLDPSSLADDEVMSLFEDRAGILWIGTRAGGVSRWNPATWAFGLVTAAHAGADGLSKGYVSSFTEDRAGRLWVGTVGGGIDVFDRAAGAVRHYRKTPGRAGSLGDDRVVSLLCDRAGIVWVGTMDGGLSRFEPSTGTFRTYRAEPSRPGSLSANGVMSLFEDRDGALWVGTYRGGLNRYDRRTDSFTAYRNDPSDAGSLSGDIVTAIAEGPAGALWVGTEGAGLDRLDKSTGKFQRFRHDPKKRESLCDDTVYSLYQDPADTLWVGTRSGLARLGKTNALPAVPTFQAFDERDGLPNKVVYGILPDAVGRLWLSTNMGLARFDARTGGFRSYVKSNGLQGNEFNFGAHYRSAKGELFFGGPNGFNAFFAETIPTAAQPPQIVLTAFLKFNRAQPGGLPPFALDRIRLGYRDQVVTFEFSALAFAAPERNHYQYKLDGFDPDWIDLGGVHRVTYTSLPSGNYVFRVNAANADGVWSEKGLAVPLAVLPPPWKTGWAYLAYVLVAALGVAAVVRAQQRKLARETDYRRRLEVEVEARTIELGKQNQELDKLNNQLLETSLTDSLTGLRNRRFLFEEVGKEMGLVQRHYRERELGLRKDAEQLIFIMIDLDWFKPINDACGHTAGDNVLRQVRAILEKACRTSDVLVRWGGDEFLVVGRIDDLEGVEAVPERIREMISESAFDLGDGQTAHLTCSIGFTCYPAGASDLLGLSLEQVVGLADRALYAAKKMGRNAWVGLLGTEKISLADATRTLEDVPEAAVGHEGFAVRRSTETHR
jgi:diguanylate cyclase (GGDEF)-like protein